MNIHIFGHSICLRSRSNIPSFTDILATRYDIKPHQLHISLCGSEERILYFLKKQKEPIDLAIIFHGDPGLVFVPPLERDMHPYALDSDFWGNTSNNVLTYFENITKDKSETSLQKVSLEDFKKAYEYFLKYFYTKDLNTNRHYGALIQIDQYLKYKNIPAIHCILEYTAPTWFTFTSGIVDTEITKMQDSSSIYRCDKRISFNKINKEGNRLIAEKITQYINRTAQCYPKIKSLVRPAGIEPTF